MSMGSGGIFGNSNRPDTGGIFGNPMGGPMVVDTPPQRPAPQDGKMSPWKAALGGLLDSIAQQTGGQAMFMPQMLKRQDRDWEAQKLQQRSDSEYQRQLDLEKYKIAHREPPEDSFLRAMAAAGIQPNTPQYQQMALQRAQMLTQPVQLVSDGMGGMTAVRPNTMGTPAPVGQSDWDSAKPYGGSQPAPVPFGTQPWRPGR